MRTRRTPCNPPMELMVVTWLSRLSWSMASRVDRNITLPIDCAFNASVDSKLRRRSLRFEAPNHVNVAVNVTISAATSLAVRLRIRLRHRFPRVVEHREVSRCQAEKYKPERNDGRGDCHLEERGDVSRVRRLL